MKVNINYGNTANDKDIKNYIHYRLGFAFSRNSQLIRSITINLTDINGPKGGIDQQCKVMIKSNLLQDVVITERQADIKHAIDRGINRAGKNFMQCIKRRKIISKKRFYIEDTDAVSESA
ncbi:hypothetical protein [Oceanicoccus sp. KOV_DT_Chl]|uniref:hypothetical protein n=1 Tax=Oceanicoccus sp. KOV_DT_Chl TaxID=1904639 RepID=UPI000C7AEE5F|nr:hypothetical protein [Oceanicoccus sp. KOV_DT_Chl]